MRRTAPLTHSVRLSNDDRRHAKRMLGTIGREENMQKLSSLITLGTASPSQRRGRAQFSNLLTVNGTHYVVDAGDGVTALRTQALIFERSESFLLRTIMTITQQVLER